MRIREVKEDKKRFLPLLLLADEQENMIDRYLERGTLYVLEEGGVKAECVVTDEGAGILEIKNIAVAPTEQGKGYGKTLIAFLARRYAGSHSNHGQLKFGEKIELPNTQTPKHANLRPGVYPFFEQQSPFHPDE